MGTSSLIPDHAFNAQESPGARPELQTESNRLRLLLDMTNTLVSNLESREVLRAVSASIRQVMRCDTVGVWLPDSEQVHLRQLAMDFPESRGFVREDLLHPVEGSLLGRVFKTGKPFVLGVMSEEMAPEEAPEARAEALESGCALPLISRGRTLGVLTLASRVENSFSPEDVDFLMRAAGQVAIAIENALAYREIAELKDKLAQEKLYLEDQIRGEMDFEGIVGHWPGNIRELENFIERSVILTHGTALQAPIAELSNNGRTAPVTGTREAYERAEIVRVLKITDGRVAGPDGAAARMDIKRTTLISRMKKLGIDPRKIS